MTNDSEKIISEWRPVSELRMIEENISEFGYSKKFIDENGLNGRKSPHCSNGLSGRVNFFEPIEVKEDGGEVFFRENEERKHMEEPEIFQTQYGIFNNHNNGEFISWLGKDDFYIEGNFCDMFDCGEYTYAISNQMHMGLGLFKIVRISQNLESVVMYDNYSPDDWICLKYDGRFRNEKGYIIIASGFSELNRNQDGERNFQDKTLLFQIDNDGNCSIAQEWKVKISSPNSIAVLDGLAYFGQNKMVTRLNLSSGEITYFTNKSDAELAALKKMF